MTRQTVLGFKIGKTEESLTAHGGLALMAEYNRKVGLRECEVAETVHSMEKTQEGVFSLIVKREVSRYWDLYDSAAYHYHGVASNGSMDDKDALAVLEWHNQRGQVENFNKSLKGGFGLDGVPCGQFEANAVFFRIAVMAYHLFMGFKELPCLKEWRLHTIETFVGGSLFKLQVGLCDMRDG